MIKKLFKLLLRYLKNQILKKGELNISNIEIFNALVERLTLARRWKDRIKRHFCREVYFNQLLKKLSSTKDIDPVAVEKDKKIAEKLRKQNLNTLYSGRTLKDILERFDLKNYKEPRSGTDKKNVKIIKEYLKISCPIDKAPDTLNKFFKKNKLNLFISDDYFPVIQITNIRIKFSANINRSLEYYSGMVFNISVNKKGKKNVLVSGGRYDGLLKNLGSKKDTSAVGAAIDMSLL